MECSVEISMYVLSAEYNPAIINFIKRLRNHPFITIETNGMSTQVFGDYKRVMKAINTEIKNTFIIFTKFFILIFFPCIFLIILSQYKYFLYQKELLER